MRSRSVLSVTTAFFLGISAMAGARDVAPPAAAEIVRVDVVVTDADGRLVTDLTRADFEVLEDGKRQRLTDFVTMAGSTVAEEATAASPSETAVGAAPAVGRHVMIVVDELHLSRRSVDTVRETLRRFLDEAVSPEDFVALVLVGSPEAIVQPTRDRAPLHQALGRINPRGDSILTGHGAQLTPEQAEQILRGEHAALQLGTRLQADEAGSVFSGMTPRNTASDPTPIGIAPEDKAAALDVQRQARGILAEALSLTDVSLGTVEDVLRSTESLPGRKLCLFVSDGFLLGRGTSDERSQQMRLVVDAATRSGTAIYTLAAGGLAPIGADASTVGGAGPAGLRDRVARAGERQTLETLEELADDTGGFLLRGGDAIDAGLLRMLADNSSVYLLAYEPSNQKRDGRFRKLAVRLPQHRDYVVRTRSGYFAADKKKRDRDDRRTARVLPLSPVQAQLALGAPPRTDGLPVSLSADYVDLVPGGPQAIVKGYVDPSGLAWRDVKGRRQAAFDLIAGVYDEEGQPVISPFAGQHFAFDVPPAELERLKETGVRFEKQLPLKPGSYEIRMLALDPAHAPLGGASREIEIPDLAERRLTLSSVFLSSVAESGAAGAAAEGVRPAQVLRRFKTSDDLYFQVYVYNAARDGAGESDVVLQAQVHSAGKPLFASKPRPASLQEKDGAPLPETDGMPLAGLAPGTYELHIVASDRKANSYASRSIDFTVVE